MLHDDESSHPVVGDSGGVAAGTEAEKASEPMTAPGLSRDERERLARAMFEADCAQGVTDCETWAELCAKGWDAGYDEAACELVAELAKVGLAVWGTSSPADAVPALHEIEIAAARAVNPERGQFLADCLSWLRSAPLQESLVTTSLVDFLLARGWRRAAAPAGEGGTSP